MENFVTADIKMRKKAFCAEKQPDWTPPREKNDWFPEKPYEKLRPKKVRYS